MNDSREEINELKEIIKEHEEKIQLLENKLTKIRRITSLHIADLEKSVFTLTWLNTQLKDLIKDI